MFAALFARVLPGIISSLVGKLFEALGLYFERRRAEATLVQLGAEKVRAENLKTVAAVEAAYAEIATRHRDAGTTSDSLRSGRF